MKLSSNWKKLSLLKSPTHIIDIDTDMGCGWIRDKVSNKKVFYLSTHTFYEECINGSNRILRGFNFDGELTEYRRDKLER